MTNEQFYMEKINESCDKEIVIYGDDIKITIDYDDVNHRKVKREAKKILSILNTYWNDEK